MTFILCLSGEHYAGKDTVASYMCEKYGFTRYAFADKLKAITADRFNFDHNLMHIPEEKDKLRAEYGNKSLRDLCDIVWKSYLETDKTYFCEQIVEDIIRDKTQLVVISDLRYTFEMKTLIDKFGKACIRPILISRSDNDADILNISSLDDLYTKVDRLLIHKYEIVIVGAGVAGISCAQKLFENKKDFIVIECGKPVEERDRDRDVASGFGGAGLFSDGKYSFYPASTELYKLKNIQKHVDEIIKAFPNTDLNPKVDSNHDLWLHKPYPCVYQSLDDRLTLLKKQQEILKNCILFNHKITFSNDKRVLIVNNKLIHYEKLVLAGGRFISIDPVFNWIPKVFRRFEYGVRLEAPSHSVLFSKMYGIDPKYLNNGFRTFCCCREGEVVLVSDISYAKPAYSGRADGPRTNFSNIGFNVRVPNEIDLPKPFVMSLQAFLDCDVFEDNKLLQTGLLSLLDNFKVGEFERSCMKVYGPTLEGVGEYFDCENVYTNGDASGVFRGLVAAMASGSWLGEMLCE